MQTINLRKISIIRTKHGLNGYPTSLALMRKAMSNNHNLDVQAMLFLHLPRDLPAMFRNNDKFNVLDCLDVDSLEEVRKRLDNRNVTKNSLIFIDSLLTLIEQFSLPSTSWLLNQLSELSACVLALIDDNNQLEEEEWRRLESISTNLFQLELAEDGTLLCRTSSRKRDETFETKLEQFKILPDYSIQTSDYIEPDAAAKILQEVQALSLAEKEAAASSSNGKFSFDIDKLPFDVGLNLSEQERRAKANVQLPFMAAQSQKGLVGLNISSGKKVRAGGQIIYTPEEEDDFDDSDPDDDLTI